MCSVISLVKIYVYLWLQNHKNLIVIVSLLFYSRKYTVTMYLNDN